MVNKHSAFMLGVVKLLLKGEVGVCALNSHGYYIVDNGNSWKNHEIVFLNFCGYPDHGIHSQISFFCIPFVYFYCIVYLSLYVCYKYKVYKLNMFKPISCIRENHEKMSIEFLLGHLVLNKFFNFFLILD